MNKYLCGNTGIGTHTRLSSRCPVDGGGSAVHARIYLWLARVVPGLDLCVQQLQRSSVIDITRRTLVSTRQARSLTKKLTGSCPPTDRTLHARTIIAPARQPTMCDVRCSREKDSPFSLRTTSVSR